MPVAVAVRADAADADRIRASLRDAASRGVDVRFVELPSRVAAPRAEPDVEGALARARKAYVLPDVPKCLAALGGDDLVPTLLFESRRATAARVLFWRVACHVTGGAMPDAARVASEFAGYGLDVPPDVEVASPEPQAVLGRAISEVSAAPAVQLRVLSAAPGAAVAVDGRAALCKTPCRVDVRPGRHVVALELDGFVSERRTVTSTVGETVVDVTLAPAPPELAGAQWSARYGAIGDADSPGSVRLLAQAVRARSLVVLSVPARAPSPRLKGVLAVGGETRARAERGADGAAGVGAAAPPVLDELLREGRLVESTPLVKRPLFWVGVITAAAAATAATYAVTQKPKTRTEVGF